MRKKILQVLFIVLSAGFITSCQKDSGNDPATSTADRDKFLGTWITQSSGTSGTLNFTMTITAGASSSTQLIIKNFENEGAGTSTTAEISGSSISVPQQLVVSDTIQGTGTYNSNNTLSFNYTMRDGQTVDTRTATAHK